MIGSGQFGYRTLTASVRPSRHAIGYPADEHWIATARRLIASLCRVWAGAQSVVLPVSIDGRCDESLLKVLRMFDPDYIGRHIRTLSDLAALKPTAFDRIASQYAAAEETPQDAKARLLRDLGADPVGDPGDWEQFAVQIDRCCAPHAGRGLAGTHRFTESDFRISNPDQNPGAADGVLPLDNNDEWLALDLDRVPPEFALMIESRVGQLDQKSSDGLCVVRLPVTTEDYPALASLAITGSARKLHALAERYRQAQSQGSGMSGTPNQLGPSGLLRVTPYARTRRWTVEARDFDTVPLIIVAGNDAADHALAMLCDRIFDHSCWLPLDVVRGEDEVSNALLGTMHDLWNDWAARYRRDETPTWLTSTSMTRDELEELLGELEPAYGSAYSPPAGRNGPWMKCVTVDEISRLGGHRWLVDAEYGSTPMSVPVRESEGTVEQLTPLMAPLAQARRYLGEQLRWQIDVILPGHRLPQIACLPREMLSVEEPGGLPEAHVRTGRLGLCFSSDKAGLAAYGAGPEWSVARPRLRFPSAVEIFGHAARRKNATVRLSPAGRRASLAIHKWGSLEQLTDGLRGTTRKLLDAFTPPSRTGNFAYATGYCIRRKGYISYEHAAELIGDEARERLDKLSRKALIRRGLILSCERCRWQDFVAMSQLTDTFRCQACGTESHLTQGRWDAQSPEPVWFYDLDQIMRDLIAEHGDVPLLAIDKLRQDARSLLYCPELEIVPDGQTSACAETDICVIIDGQIVTGEAKSSNALDGSTRRAANKIVKAAEILGADRLILATATAGWAPSVRPAVDAALTSAAAAFWRPVSRVEEIVNVT